MNDTINEIYKVLIADTTLTNMLASNKPAHNPSGTSARTNSIVPQAVASEKMNVPFIMLAEGSETKIGSKLLDESLYVRCYNDRKKSNVVINQIIERVKTLLDGKVLTLTSRRQVEKVKYETTLPPLLDEEVNLRFRESRYRLFLL